MYDEKFERFLLKQIRRESAIYYGIMFTFACCTIACVVMGVAALIIYRSEALGIILKLVSAIAILAGCCYGSRSMARDLGKAAKDMEYVLEHTEQNALPEYTEETKETRLTVCQNIRSIWGVIISYGILALMLWAVTLLLVCLVLYAGLSYGALLGAFATFSMALGLSILTIAYICDLPKARRYRKLIENQSNQ